MKKKTNDTLKNKSILIGLSVLCTGLIAVSFLENDAVSPIRQASGFVITPIQKGINGFGSWLSGLTDNFEDAVSLRKENEELQAKVDTLTEENTQLVQDKEELTRLRELLSLDEQYDDYEKVGARVIAKESGNWFQLFTIDKGSSDGIQKDCNVISGGGLVGIVTEVGPNWATVRSIIDDNSNVSAMVSTTSDQCIIAGDLRLIDEGSLNLVKLTDSDNKVHVGDKVVTSYISEKFLPGILIGYITPVVDFRHLQEVLVILQRKEYVPSDSTSSSSPDASAANAGDALDKTDVSSETQSETQSETSAAGE